MWEHWSLLGVHLALKEAPQFAAAQSNPDINQAFVYLLGHETPEAFLEDYQAVGRGDLPARAGFNCCFPTVHDPLQSRRPGMHTGNITQMAPFDLKEGSDRWYSLPFKREAAARCLSTLRKYAPNITEDKVHSFYVSTPLDIENKFSNMVKGSIKVGQYHPLQMGYLRPNEQCSTHRSPVKNLYMGGACTHPGGTVILGAGYLAANAVAEDKGIAKWWNEPEMVTRVRQQGLLP
ncbi:MAG: hypothetical protein HW414_1041 [Dehalococcoidia bacterium]|nr:hypothetical protein [Dehalococcoidia bacterium]